MPRKRERTTTKASWTVDTLENPIKTLQTEGKSVYKVSRETGIPYSTLKKRFKLAKTNSTLYNRSPRLGRHPVFNDEQESLLADYLRKMSNMFYGLTRNQFCKLCYDMAAKFGVTERFNQQNKRAGRDWFENFMRRHPDLSIRKPEAISINRITGFNRDEVNYFFKNLEEVMTKFKFEAANIFNMDETGITTVQEPEKIIATKGQKRIGSITSWERGKNVTVICAMSAAGSFVPPLFVFPRQRHSPHLERDGPPGAVYTCSQKGWSNENIFIIWLKHFIKISSPTAEKPILLIMDNHNSHATLEAWELARNNNITMLTIPPHSSHRLQPLDVTFFGPLKKAYNKECDLYLKSKKLEKISPYDIAGLFNKSYSRVASLDKGIAGFRSTGIFPINPAVFGDEDFAAVEADLVNTVTSSTSEETQQQQRMEQDFQHSEEVQSAPNPYENIIISDNQPSTSFAHVLTVVSPNVPSLKKTSKISKNKQHSEILTKTPMKDVFEEKKKHRLDKESKTTRITKNKRKGKMTKVITRKKVKKNLFESDTSSKVSIDENMICDDKSEYSDKQNECSICMDVGKNNELWYRCRNCGNWSHSECSGCDNPENYICVFCLEL